MTMRDANVLDHGALGDGSADDTQAFEDARDYAAANNVPVVIPAGTFLVDGWDLSILNLKVRCDPCTVLQHTGTGRFITMDRGSGSNLFNIHLTGHPTLIGNQNTTDLIYARGAHHLRIDARLRDCHTGFRADFTVLSKLNLVQSVNQGPFPHKTPTHTVYLDKLGSAEPSTANELYIISEGVSSFGIWYQNAQSNRILGGTSEANGGGMALLENSHGNLIEHLFCEANSIRDFSIASPYNCLRSCTGGSQVGSYVTGARNRFDHGHLNKLELAAYGQTLDCVHLTGAFSKGGFAHQIDGCHAYGVAIS